MGLFDKLRQAESDGSVQPSDAQTPVTDATDLGTRPPGKDPEPSLEAPDQAVDAATARSDLAKAMERGRESALQEVAAALASALAHLAVQAVLVERPDSELSAADIGQTAGRLLNRLDSMGISTVGSPGEADQFDPNWHVPLRTDDRFREGDAIIVRTPAVVAPSGRVVRKAGVEQA